MRSWPIFVAGLLLVAGVNVPVALAEPAPCEDASCVPGIGRGAIEGGYCEETTYYVFNIIADGRYVFCGSPRRLAPRWYLASTIRGIKIENEPCPVYMYSDMAQGPDGLFLSCVVERDKRFWARGDT